MEPTPRPRESTPRPWFPIQRERPSGTDPAPGHPWQRISATTFSGLFDLPGPALHLPRYPCYTPDLARHFDYDYFFLRSQGYLSCQAARFLLFGGSFVTLADDAAVHLPTDLSPYWSGFYREHFPDRIGPLHRYSGGDGFRVAVAQHPRLRVVSPHPFDSALIPAQRYYLDDPALVVRLNDKGRLHELCPQVLPHQLLEPADFAADRWRRRWPLPFVVKLTEPCGGGDGVVLARTEADLREARRRFAGRRVKVERLVEAIRRNYNVQLQVGVDGCLRYIGGSVQRVQAGGAYEGNGIDLDWMPPPKVAAICDQAARAAAALGWHGVCGLDLIEDADGAVWLIDPNFRLNGSTPFFLLGEFLRARLARPHLVTGYFRYPGSPIEVFERFRREIHRRVLVPVGAHFDPAGDGCTRLYGALVNDGDPEAAEALVRQFAAKQLLPGLGLSDA